MARYCVPAQNSRAEQLPVSVQPSAASAASTSLATPRQGPGADPPTVDQSKDSTPSPAVNRLFGPYLILSELDHGGMGVVYHVRDVRLDREVALKVIRSGVLALPEEIQRFNREAKAVAQLKHPNIVPLYDVGQVDGHCYFTMELARGGSLARQRQRFQGDPKAAVRLLIKVARAVQYVHERGMLHRDLKPGNILLGDGDQPLISDFGLAKAVGADPELTRPGAAVGTPAYMAPEQAAGESQRVGPAADVWSLGVIVYEFICGSRPFVGIDNQRLADAIVSDPPRPPRASRPGLDRDIETILLKCLEKEPDHRYATAGALADDLEAWLEGRPIQARPIGRLRRLGRWIRRRRMAVAASVLPLVAVGVLTLIWPATDPVLPPQNGKADPDEPLKKIENEMKQGRAVMLLGRTGEPAWLRWLAPGKVQGPANEAFTIQSENKAMLLLLPESKTPRYRIDAELRPDAKAKGAGLFVCHSAHETGNGPLNAQCVARLNVDTQKTYMELVHHVPNKKELNYRGVQVVAAKSLPPSQTTWYRLSIKVSPAGIVMVVDGIEVASLAAAKRLEFANALLQGRQELRSDVHPVFGPLGGLGLFVEAGVVSFRNVDLTPLPANPP
jgi:hypothetical protein